MPLFEIPYYQRIVNVTKSDFFFKNVEIMHVDEVGIFLLYDIEKQKNVNFIRRHLVERRRGKCYIKAGSIHRALKRFYIKHEGARVGGPRREAKALWINNDEFIYELPHCYLMRKNRKREFICGKPLKEDDGLQGEYGMCVLEENEAPPNCVISSFRDCAYNYGEKELARAARNVDGFKFIELRTLMPF